MYKPLIRRMPEITEELIEHGMHQARRERARAFASALRIIRDAMKGWRRSACRTVDVATVDAEGEVQ